MRFLLNVFHRYFRAIRRSPEPPRRLRRRSPLFLILLLVVWSAILGWGMAQATDSRAIATTDPIPERLQLGQELYLENCGSCHIALPPAIMPDETWRQLIQDPQHFGVQINPLRGPSVQLVWNYLRYTSRPLTRGEATPYRIRESRYFKALHPRVEVPRSVNVGSCATCHPGASQFNFRSLTPEWDNTP